MQHVVVGTTLGLTRSHRQKRRRPLQCLDLGFLVDAEHDGVIRRVHVQTHDVAYLLDQEWVVGEPKGLHPMRMQIEGTPTPIRLARSRVL